MKKYVKDITKERAKALRVELTKSEKIIWSKLRAKQIFGLHVRRQHPVGPYITDFCIERIKVVIELDGESHDFSMDKDNERDLYLRAKGYEILRIKNVDVLKNIDDVVEYIRVICKRKTTNTS